RAGRLRRRSRRGGVTHGATLVGTFGYMPPEQLGGTVDATADLYALGATLVHLVGRKAPEDILGPDLELRLDHLNVSPAFRVFLGRRGNAPLAQPLPSRRCSPSRHRRPGLVPSGRGSWSLSRRRSPCSPPSSSPG